MRNASSSTSSKTPCCTKVGLKRGPWTPEEDELLANYIHKEGEGRWRTLPKRAGLLRCGKSCRLRWMNYLRPSVKRGQIAPDEEDLILRLHRLLGNRWSLIAGRIPGRTDNEIKNYWNTHLSKKLISQGIDPRTHKPLNPSSPGDNKASSSKANPINPSPKPNNIPVTTHPSLEETPIPSTAGGRIVVNKVNNGYYFEGTNLQDHQYPSGTACNGSVMGLIRRSHGLSNEDDDDINYCTDDVFSSFLNSLISEDLLINGQHQVQQQPNGIALLGSDPLIASAQTFGFGTGWEAAVMSSASADTKRLNDHFDQKPF